MINEDEKSTILIFTQRLDRDLDLLNNPDYISALKSDIDIERLEMLARRYGIKEKTDEKKETAGASEQIAV